MKGSAMEFLSGNSVDDADGFRRPRHNINGETISSITETNITNAKAKTQCFLKHDRFNPVRVPFPSHHKKRYPVIEISKANLSNLYFRPLEGLAGKLFYHANKTNKNGSYKKRRSSVRERITHNVGQLLLHYNNLDHMTLGYKDSKGLFHASDVNLLYTKSGYSKKRVTEALKIFEMCGYIKIKNHKTRLPNGEWRSEYAHIEVSPTFYYDLGISDVQLDEYRFRFKKKEEKIAREESKKEYYKTQRTEKREFKAHRKNLSEMPGSERKRDFHTAPAYRDYTGVSQNPSLLQNTPEEAQSPSNRISAIGEYFLADMMKKFRPPK